MRKFIHFAQPQFGKEEKKELLAALDSGWVTLGPRTKQFEEDFARFIGANYAVGVTSCTAGLHIALLAAGVEPGDEVITTPFTFVASANPIIHVGAIPVFVDIDLKTFTIDPKKIEEKITKKTKVIIPVHYGGQAADMDAIRTLAKKYHLKIIEDAAHAAGSSYKGKKIGSLSDFAVFSFHPVKNMSTGDGGMITVKRKEDADTLNVLRLHGMSRDAWKRHSATGTWRYDIEMIGFKYNMTDLAAALGIQQLKKLDNFITIRKEYAKLFNELFAKVPEITIPFVAKDREHIYTLYTILVDTSKLSITRDELVDALKQAQIGVNIQFIPVHYFTAYQKRFGYKQGDFPVAEKVFEECISLPLFPGMKKGDVVYVAKIVISLINKHRKKKQ